LEAIRIFFIRIPGQGHGPDGRAFKGFDDLLLGFPETVTLQDIMFIQLLDELLDLFSIQKFPKTAHEFRLDVNHGMVSIKETDDKKGGIGNKENLPREIQWVPQADDLLTGDFRREDIDVPDSGIYFFFSHESTLLNSPVWLMASPDVYIGFRK
jgi:hypothetical protein